MDQREAAELDAVEGRLLAEFGESVPPAEVERCFQAAVAAFEDVPVRTYVALLIERHAGRELRAVH
jgi:hypothetical protein